MRNELEPRREISGMDMGHDLQHFIGPILRVQGAEGSQVGR